jgi:hypothetical protein
MTHRKDGSQKNLVVAKLATEIHFWSFIIIGGSPSMNKDFLASVLTNVTNVSKQMST